MKSHCRDQGTVLDLPSLMGEAIPLWGISVYTYPLISRTVFFFGHLPFVFLSNTPINKSYLLFSLSYQYNICEYEWVIEDHTNIN